MPICIGPSASAVLVAPTLTLDSSTNYNQNSGVLNATVAATGNKPITSVEFQWSTSSTFASGNSSWTAASTNTTINQGTTNTARTYGPSGLSNNTTYYVRFRATNANGHVTTSSIGASFKTYKLNTESFTGSRTWTNPVPTSGTSGLAITQILNLEVRAGGAGGWSIYGAGGGGGAGARTTSSSASISGNVTVTVGAGAGWYATGGTTSIGSLLSAAGGVYGLNSPDGFSGGASGNGNSGGSGNTYGAGGGGGTNGAGGNGSGTGAGGTGGTGGAGWSSGLGVGGTGGTFFSDTPSNGGANTGNGGSPGGNSYGGGTNSANEVSGGSGYAYFEYWGP